MMPIFLADEVAENKKKAKTGKPCVRWKRSYEGVKSDLLQRDCSLPDGRPVCCAAVGSASSPSSSSSSSRGVGMEGEWTRDLRACSTSKVYLPSAYEQRHFEFARQVASISDERLRLKKLIECLSSPSEIRHNHQWLKLVKFFMSVKGNRQFMKRNFIPQRAHTLLSKHLVTRTCLGADGSNETDVWEEFIEPITMHARHPFALASCQHIPEIKNAFPISGGSGHRAPPHAPIMDIDYVMLQSNRNLYFLPLSRNSSGGCSGNSCAAVEDIHPKTLMPQSSSTPRNKHFLIDAGSSTFESSLFWFSCAYSQVGISFDRVLAFEKNLLEPSLFWNQIPVKWMPYWSFYNIPVNTSDHSVSSSPSPLFFIEQLAQPHDFVSFKLDIDHPEIEIRLAQEILSNSRISSLVDEFFFEIHFRCEIMTKCGWRNDIEDVNGFILERQVVMQFFREMREKGIRAHFWP